ncbi:MAG: thioredoxin [Firmicutes bacterium]|nr:thioredoxin [Bacillota bacterium]
MSEIKLTEANFEEEVLKSDIPVLVDFWASWCGPCMMLAPVVEEIAKEYEGKIKVGKVNVDEQQRLAVQYRISSIPALKLFKNGEAAAETVGYMSKEELEAFIQE